MRALVYERYGPPDVVALREVPLPEPAADALRVRVRATTVTSADVRLRGARFPPGFALLARLALGVTGPRRRILGLDVAGEVAAVGAAVTRFAVGQRVTAFTDGDLGCHAEYVCVRESGCVVPIPDGVDDATAAALSFGGMTALAYLRDRARLQAGERVIVIGAAGSVGSAAVQLARHLGAHVTAVCRGANAEFVRAQGAHDVIDYTRDDYRSQGRQWDVVFDAVGDARYGACRHVLAPGGRLCLLVPGLWQLLTAPWVGLTTPHRVCVGDAGASVEHLRFLADLAARGVFRPHIDRVWDLDEAVAAHAYVDSGRKRGNVVLRVGAGDAGLLPG